MLYNKKNYVINWKEYQKQFSKPVFISDDSICHLQQVAQN